MLSGLFILDANALDLVYGPEELEEIKQHVQMVAPPQTRQSIAANPGLLEEIDVLFSGWGGPRIDEDFLVVAKNLKTIFYAGGAIGGFATEAMWSRGIAVTTAADANAKPVAEYTLATILFSLKHGWSLARQTRQTRTFVPRDLAPGNYESTVGIISLGMIGRKVARLLAETDLKVVAYDPYLSPAEIAALGAESVSLMEVFELGHVVSLHTPVLPETLGMIGGEHFAAMKRGATFINTARGEVVREQEMIGVLQARQDDLHAVLDVTAEEPPPSDSLLYSLPNVILTPHIAGSAGNECRRMGRYMVEELQRYVAGVPLKWSVTPEAARNNSHRPVSVKVSKRLRSVRSEIGVAAVPE
jgi:phosphoglycerate dehydrogenase-like enzyme